ncbi:probable crossover junction endonuclease EME2 isoform X3 [Chlorocebus sabaeus]|uniref:probable crossover junction endonuclease EME2 isoform X3 n=1 Tax=Chlorocebus sabaeus TaxID=60711 RepID=UPI003BF96558
MEALEALGCECRIEPQRPARSLRWTRASPDPCPRSLPPEVWAADEQEFLLLLEAEEFLQGVATLTQISGPTRWMPWISPETTARSHLAVIGLDAYLWWALAEAMLWQGRPHGERGGMVTSAQVSPAHCPGDTAAGKPEGGRCRGGHRLAAGGRGEGLSELSESGGLGPSDWAAGWVWFPVWHMGQLSAVSRGAFLWLLLTGLPPPQALVLLQLWANLDVLLVASWQELSQHVCAITKALAQCPLKQYRESQAFSFCTAGRWAAGEPVARDGTGLRGAWRRQIRQFSRVSPAVADAVVTAFPSPRLLQQALEACSTEQERMGLLADLPVLPSEGGRPRRVGPDLSRRICLFLTTANPDLLLDLGS